MKWTNKGHQFDAYEKIFKQRNHILIYGGAWKGKNVYEQIKFMGCVDAFLDKNLELQKLEIEGLPCRSPEELFDKHNESHLIIIAMGNKESENDVCRRLMLAGYVENLDFWRWEDFNNDIIMSVYWLFAQGKVVISSSGVLPSSVCNLNCAKCLNFNPYLNEKKLNFTLKPEEAKKDIDIFFDWVDYTPWYNISGGDPLTYPFLEDIIIYLGENYRQRIGKRFELVTNGTMVPSDQICELLSKYNMDVAISDYRENVPKYISKRQELLEKLKRYNIPYLDLCDIKSWFDLDVFNTDNSCMSEFELIEYHDRCATPWNRVFRGKLYSCLYESFAIASDIVPMDLSDTFDLLQPINIQSKREFIEFVSGYSEKGYTAMCSRCSGWGDTVNQKRVPVAEQAPWPKHMEE